MREILLPQLKRGTTIVMDNATFHKTPKTRRVDQENFLPGPSQNPT
ncbi:MULTISPECIES: hypothetical protein [unclassified Wolbachia]|nr:hypothetical protein [Wolbachia endosymbiont (group A) of Apoderus coryli]